MTALMWACVGLKTGCVDALLEVGAAVSTITKHGFTVLKAVANSTHRLMATFKKAGELYGTDAV